MHCIAFAWCCDLFISVAKPSHHHKWATGFSACKQPDTKVTNCQTIQPTNSTNFIDTLAHSLNASSCSVLCALQLVQPNSHSHRIVSYRIVAFCSLTTGKINKNAPTRLEPHTHIHSFIYSFAKHTHCTHTQSPSHPASKSVSHLFMLYCSVVASVCSILLAIANTILSKFIGVTTMMTWYGEWITWMNALTFHTWFYCWMCDHTCSPARSTTTLLWLFACRLSDMQCALCIPGDNIYINWMQS